MLVAGCSGGSKASVTTGPRASIQTNESASITATRTPTAKELKGKLLSVRELPAGWSVDSSSSESDSCVRDSTEEIPGRVTKEVVSFTMDPDEGPFLMEEAVAFRDPDAAFNAIPDAMAKCGKFSGDDSGVHLEFTVAPMSFQTVGDRSVAYRVSVKATQGGVHLTLSIFAVFFERNGVIGDVIFGGLHVDLDDFTPLVMKAVSKF
jgi:hypothetical protein